MQNENGTVFYCFCADDPADTVLLLTSTRRLDVFRSYLSLWVDLIFFSFAFFNYFPHLLNVGLSL